MMRKLLVLFSVFTLLFVGCQNSDDSSITGPVSGDGGTGITSSVSPVLSVADTIDGSLGGAIILNCDTTINGITQTVHVNLHFQKGAFDGIKVITAVANFDSISFSFFPHLIFNDSNLVILTAHFTGVNLNSLPSIQSHDTSGSKYRFCYFGNGNSYEIIKNDTIDVNNASLQIGVKNARLKHFSRYSWATRE